MSCFTQQGFKLGIRKKMLEVLTAPISDDPRRQVHHRPPCWHWALTGVCCPCDLHLVGVGCFCKQGMGAALSERFCSPIPASEAKLQ